MDEQNRYPDQSPDGPSGDPDSFDHTRPIPRDESSADADTYPPMVGPFYGSSPWGAATATQAPPAPRTRGLSAAVLVGALVLGGAAGVGGAAAFNEFNQDSTTSTTDSGDQSDYQATKTAVLESGTVEKVANAVLPSVVKINVNGQTGSGSGSGIVLSEDGEILTNNHVVAGVGNDGAISVSFNDGTTRKATLVGADPMTDIAVIKVDGASDLQPAALGKSGSLRVGQTVVAVGSPYGLNATVTSGIVSALNRPVSVSNDQSPRQPGRNSSTTYPAIQTDAAINPGNSGGALVDLSGRVVGINSSIRTSSSSGGLTSEPGGSIGLGFAIPIDEVLPIVNQISAGEEPTHARLAVTVASVAADPMTQGAQIQSVERGGAADKAGLAKGDVIIKVDDQVIEDSESLIATIRGHRPGDDVQITYLRDGDSRTTTADLGSDQETSAP